MQEFDVGFWPSLRLLPSYLLPPTSSPHNASVPERAARGPTTLYDYVYRAVPFGTAGTLAPDEVYGLVAVLLFMNGIVPEGAVMNAQTFLG